MGCLDGAAAVEDLLREELVLTQEVRQMALEWRRRGALWSLGCRISRMRPPCPLAELAAQGWQPLHRTLTHAVGRQ